MPASRKDGAYCWIMLSSFGPSPRIIPCIPSRISWSDWAPVCPNWDINVLAALMTSRKSTPYVSAMARAASVIWFASPPVKPVVTVVILPCRDSSVLYFAQASDALPIMAVAAPMPAPMRAVFDVSISVRLPVTPIFCPIVSMIPPNCPNFPLLISLWTPDSSVLASLMRCFSWSKLCDRALP